MWWGYFVAVRRRAAKSHRVRVVSPDGVVATLAGSGAPGYSDGAGALARFDTPRGIALAPDGALYIADYKARRRRRIRVSVSTPSYMCERLGAGICA